MLGMIKYNIITRIDETAVNYEIALVRPPLENVFRAYITLLDIRFFLASADYILLSIPCKYIRLNNRIYSDRSIACSRSIN